MGEPARKLDHQVAHPAPAKEKRRAHVRIVRFPTAEFAAVDLAPEPDEERWVLQRIMDCYCTRGD